MPAELVSHRGFEETPRHARPDENHPLSRLGEPS
jgi:hypothetical protein